MAIRRIVKEGDETLRKISRPVKQVDKRILTLIDDMRQTMYANDGVVWPRRRWAYCAAWS